LRDDGPPDGSCLRRALALPAAVEHPDPALLLWVFPCPSGTRDFADLSISDSSRACSRDQIRAASIQFSTVAPNSRRGNFPEVKDKEVLDGGPANGHHALPDGSRREHRLGTACHALRSQAQDMGNECSAKC